MFSRTSRALTTAVGAKRFLSGSTGRSWKKSTPVHVTAILVGCVAFEFFYGATTDALWEFLNKGKLFQHYRMDSYKLEGQEE